MQTSKGSTVNYGSLHIPKTNYNRTQPSTATEGSAQHDVTWCLHFDMHIYTHEICVLCKTKMFYINDKVWNHLFKYPTVTVFWNVKPLPSLSSCSVPVSVASSSVNKTSVFPEKSKNRVTSPSNPPLRGLAPLHSLKAHTTWKLICQKERKPLTWNTGNPIES